MTSTPSMKYLRTQPVRKRLDAVTTYFTSMTLSREEFMQHFGDRTEKNDHELDELNLILEKIRQRHIESYLSSWLPKRLFRPPLNKG